MQWDDIRIFLAIARTGQLAKAASVLGVDATTAGRRLRRLETAIGQTLLERNEDGHHLTEAGEKFHEQAVGMERLALEIATGAESGAEPSGSVRVSVSEGFGSWFLASHLPDFMARHPRVTIDLVASSGFLSPSRREADVAVLLSRPRRGPLVTRKLTDYGLGLYASRAWLSQQAPIRTTDDLGQLPLVGYVPDLLYAPELNYLSEIAAGLEPQIRSTSINAQHRLVSAGAGIAVLPCFIGEADPALVRILPQISVSRSFWLVTHADTRRFERIAAFVRWLSETVAAHRGVLVGIRS